MTNPESRRRWVYRRRLAEARVLIDGRLTCQCLDVVHGKPSTYSNHSCRCETCTKAHNAYIAMCRERRMKGRMKVQGIWFAAKANEHGKHSTYSNWGCHCDLCAEAWRDYQAWLDARPK